MLSALKVLPIYPSSKTSNTSPEFSPSTKITLVFAVINLPESLISASVSPLKYLTSRYGYSSPLIFSPLAN